MTLQAAYSRRLIPARVAAFWAIGMCQWIAAGCANPIWADDAAVAATVQPLAIGSEAPDIPFKDIRYLPRRLSELGEKQAYVVVFTTLDCPLVQRYLPKLVEIDRAYRDRGVQFLALNVGPADPLREVAYQAIRVEADFPFGKDFDAAAAKALGVERTPQLVILDSKRRLRYRGRIDGQYRLGGARPDGGREDLRLALEDILSEREVEVAETPVDGCPITVPKLPPPAEPITFSRHIARLLQDKCQDCHRSGGSAPFALANYDDAVAHAETIAEVVREERMPPWFGSREHGQFSNVRSLTADERRLVAQWVQFGMAQGDAADLPDPKVYNDEAWRIGVPDLVIKAQPVDIPANGIVDYRYLFLPYYFPRDTWVDGIEIRPQHARVLHHCNMAYVQPGKQYSDANFITGQVPGGDAMTLLPGVGVKIPAGSLLVLQAHYVTIGEATSDQLSVGLHYVRGKVQKQLLHTIVKDGSFAIPPGAGNHRVASERTLRCDAVGAGMFSHMHVRGKDMVFRALFPDGKSETLLAVPNYNFDWQMAYRWYDGQRKFPKGTLFQCVAHYDNSAFNPYNPDPTATVREGQQTHEEMMYGFFFYVDEAEQLDLAIDPATGGIQSGDP